MPLVVHACDLNLISPFPCWLGKSRCGDVTVSHGKKCRSEAKLQQLLAESCLFIASLPAPCEEPTGGCCRYWLFGKIICPGTCTFASCDVIVRERDGQFRLTCCHQHTYGQCPSPVRGQLTTLLPDSCHFSPVYHLSPSILEQHSILLLLTSLLCSHLLHCSLC